MIDAVITRFGLARMPFGRDLPPSRLHRHRDCGRHDECERHGDAENDADGRQEWVAGRAAGFPDHARAGLLTTWPV